MLVLLGKLCFVLLAMIGLTSCCCGVLKRLLRPRSRGAVSVVLSISGHDESIEYTLKSLIAQYRWAGNPKRPYQILCVDRQMDSETKFICEAISRDYSFVKICKPEQALELLRE